APMIAQSRKGWRMCRNANTIQMRHSATASRIGTESAVLRFERWYFDKNAVQAAKFGTQTGHVYPLRIAVSASLVHQAVDGDFVAGVFRGISDSSHRGLLGVSHREAAAHQLGHQHGQLSRASRRCGILSGRPWNTARMVLPRVAWRADD